MGKNWDLAWDLAEAINYVIEFVIFTLFIYEEALQIANRRILNDIATKNTYVLGVDMYVNFDYAMGWCREYFESYGILALYGCNAYSSYFYSSMMTREWGNIYLKGQRMDYKFSRI